MNETKHTPGPWEVRGLYICASTDTYIAKMLHGDNLNPPDRETYGNANLIAAAPDLLAALGSAMAFDHFIDEMYVSGTIGEGQRLALHEIMDKARAAIAKAKGGSK